MKLLADSPQHAAVRPTRLSDRLARLGSAHGALNRHHKPWDVDWRDGTAELVFVPTLESRKPSR
jgi:hypothetical protein